MADLILEGIVWLVKLMLRDYENLKPAKLHTRFLLLSVVLALPFVACGSCME